MFLGAMIRFQPKIENCLVRVPYPCRSEICPSVENAASNDMFDTSYAVRNFFPVSWVALVSFFFFFLIFSLLVFMGALISRVTETIWDYKSLLFR